MLFDVRHTAVQIEILFTGKLLNKSDDSGIIDTLIQLVADAAPFLTRWRDQTMERFNKFSFLSGLSRELRDTNYFLLCLPGHSFFSSCENPLLSRGDVKQFRMLSNCT